MRPQGQDGARWAHKHLRIYTKAQPAANPSRVKKREAAFSRLKTEIESLETPELKKWLATLKAERQGAATGSRPGIVRALHPGHDHAKLRRLNAEILVIEAEIGYRNARKKGKNYECMVARATMPQILRLVGEEPLRAAMEEACALKAFEFQVDAKAVVEKLLKHVRKEARALEAQGR